jgi:hypothetical protein
MTVRVGAGGTRWVFPPVPVSRSGELDTRARMVPTGGPCQHGGMQELPAGAGDAALEPRRSGELTAAEVASRRRNRRWLGLVLGPSVVIGGVALIAALIASSGGSSIRPLEVPPGYQAVSDGYFAYAVPSGWSQDGAYTDDVGDLDTQGATGWVAEHVGARADPPAAGETPPTSFRTFGESRPVLYSIGPPSPIRVSGATVAYRYTITRAGGFQATAVDAWQASSGAEVWLLVDANAATTAVVLASLRG